MAMNINKIITITIIISSIVINIDITSSFCYICFFPNSDDWVLIGSKEGNAQ